MKVLISRGYGAGWSTWNQSEMAIDKDLIALFERGCSDLEMEEACKRNDLIYISSNLEKLLNEYKAYREILKALEEE